MKKLASVAVWVILIQAMSLMAMFVLVVIAECFLGESTREIFRHYGPLLWASMSTLITMGIFSNKWEPSK